MRLTHDTLRDVCRLLGGLALDGASVELFSKLRESGLPFALGQATEGNLGDALIAMQRGLEDEAPEALAIEYTRLLVANAAAGARSRLPVPPWEDCYVGEDRRVQGNCSRNALKAYAEAHFGFDGMTEQPSDHIGLQVCFVAALLDEESRGERDATARKAFVSDHLRTFGPTFGRTLSEATNSDFWRAAGRAFEYLSAAL